MTDELAVGDIVVGDRARTTNAHQAQLTESVRRLGLLHPIVVNGRLELVAGFRRLTAAKSLGWARVPVRVVGTLDDALTALLAERDENTCREPLTATDMVALGRKIEAMERPEAKTRKRAGGRSGGKASGKLPEASKGDTRDKVGKAVGASGKTYEKAKKVVQAAEQEPEKFGDLPAKMDAESVDAAHKELKTRQEATAPPPHAEQSNASPQPCAEKESADDTPHPAKPAGPTAPRFTDKAGNGIPPELRDTFFDPELAAAIDGIEAAKLQLDGLYQSLVRSLSKKPYKFCHFGEASKALAAVVKPKGELAKVADWLRAGVPYAVCPKCGGGNGDGCKACRFGGVVPEWRWNELQQG